MSSINGGFNSDCFFEILVKSRMSEIFIHCRSAVTCRRRLLVLCPATKNQMSSIANTSLSRFSNEFAEYLDLRHISCSYIFRALDCKAGSSIVHIALAHRYWDSFFSLSMFHRLCRRMRMFHHQPLPMEPRYRLLADDTSRCIFNGFYSRLVLHGDYSLVMWNMCFTVCCEALSCALCTLVGVWQDMKLWFQFGIVHCCSSYDGNFLCHSFLFLVSVEGLRGRVRTWKPSAWKKDTIENRFAEGRRTRHDTTKP